MITDLKSHSIVDNETLQDIVKKIHTSKVYLKTDFKLHLQMDDPCPDHCIRYALSDSSSPNLKVQCQHSHLVMCDRCNLLPNAISELKLLLSNERSIHVSRYDFSEAQCGKSNCDAKIAHMRGRIRQYVANNVGNATEMKAAIDSFGGLITIEDFKEPYIVEGKVKQKNESRSDHHDDQVEPNTAIESLIRTEDVLYCHEEGCTRVKTFSGLKAHQFVGKHKFILNNISTFDDIKLKWKECCDDVTNPKRVNEFGTSQGMLDPNGDIIPEQSEAIETSPSEAIESSQSEVKESSQSEVKEPRQSEEEKTEHKDSNGEAHPPKSAEEKKND
ncbi:unnamed protein product [Mytilus coruscus]|uniref:C2H2-type domain-containing protein n=1 Tax=Mytilus coruscus TaxID=42192 RepID=A0A6J8C7W6_MYTCO|nr:unnamed protein product [Mytilus coruscus]